MTDDFDRSRLDDTIDTVVRQMMDLDPRRGLASRVTRSLDEEEPARRRWFLGAPTFTVVSFSVMAIIVGSVLNIAPGQPVAVPSLTVASGPPAELGPALPSAIITPPGQPVPTAVTTARKPAAPSAEAIFGQRSGQVRAASITSPSKIRLDLHFTVVDANGHRQLQQLALTLTEGIKVEGHTEGGEVEWRVAAQPQLLADGQIRTTIEVTAPVRESVSVALQRGTRTKVIETVDAAKRQVVIEATATSIRVNAPHR